jgi:hypothetical protein
MGNEEERTAEEAEQADRGLRPSWHHVRRCGSYLDLDADVGIAYADGTPGSLAELLGQPGPDPWRARRSPWDSESSSWEGPRPEEEA